MTDEIKNEELSRERFDQARHLEPMLSLMCAWK